MNTSNNHHDTSPEELKQQYQNLFASNPDYGTADNISKDGCLALAKLGHRVWNQWREDYPVTRLPRKDGEDGNRNIADFSGMTFEDGEAEFQYFKFGGFCNFAGAVFKGSANFANCTFVGSVDFNGAKFGTESQLSRRLFTADFEKSTFDAHCHFVGSEFFGQAIFNDAKFLRKATFSGVSFSKQAEFKDATLRDCTFSEVTFKEVLFDRSHWISTRFSRATFNGLANFSGVTFDGNIQFEETDFNNYVKFYATEFVGYYFEFINVTFKEKLEFNGCKWVGEFWFRMVFGSSVEFLGNEFLPNKIGVDVFGGFHAGASSWNDTMVFEDCHFHSVFKLNGAQVLNIGVFNCIFDNTADFSGLTKELVANLYGDDYKKLTDERSTKNGLSPSAFYEVQFKGCEFKSEADFRNREFVSTAIWTKSHDLSYKKMVKQANGGVVEKDEPLKSRDTVFGLPPIFHGAKLPQDCSFVHALFPKTASGKEEYERRYRTLRLALAQHGATREEQRFFQSEMAEELARIKSKQKGRYWLMRLYSCFDYGFKAFWPLVWLGLLVLLMMLSLGYKNGFALDLSGDGVSRLSCAISTLVPLLGSPKSCEGLQSIPVLTEILKFLSYTLTFLVGLALRNHLKMK